MQHPHRFLALFLSITLSLFIFLRILTDREASNKTEDYEHPLVSLDGNLGANLQIRENNKTAHATEDMPTCLEGQDQKTLFLVRALRDGSPEELQDAAADLRSELRRNPSSLAKIAQLILDPTTPLRTFANFALIAGSLDTPEANKLLLTALEQFNNEAGRAEWILYALGTWKQYPEKDDRFSFAPNGPMILETREGLATPLYHQFAKQSIYRQLLPLLDESSPNLRAAAILTLRHSLNQTSIQNAFLDTLRWETDPGNQANLAEALARQAIKLPTDSMNETVALLLKMATKPDALNIRMKVLSPLQGLPINESQQTLLTNLASNPDLANTSTRQFALSLLASRNTQANHPNPILWQSASNDPDATVRAAAIEHIRNHPVPPSPSRVVPILDSDPDWNVRYAAVETLARIPSEDEAHNALNALKNTARNDPHPEVAGRALSILNGDR